MCYWTNLLMVLNHFNPKNNVFDVYFNSIQFQFNSVLFAKSRQQLPQCALIYKTKAKQKGEKTYFCPTYCMFPFIVVSLYFILPLPLLLQWLNLATWLNRFHWLVVNTQQLFHSDWYTEGKFTQLKKAIHSGVKNRWPSLCLRSFFLFKYSFTKNAFNVCLCRPLIVHSWKSVVMIIRVDQKARTHRSDLHLSH